MVPKSGVLLHAKIRILRQELIGTASCRDGFLLSKCSPGASIPMTRMSLGWVGSSFGYRLSCGSRSYGCEPLPVTVAGHRAPCF